MKKLNGDKCFGRWCIFKVFSHFVLKMFFIFCLLIQVSGQGMRCHTEWAEEEEETSEHVNVTYAHILLFVLKLL